MVNFILIVLIGIYILGLISAAVQGKLTINKR